MLRCHALVRHAWKFGTHPKQCHNEAGFSSSPLARIPQTNQSPVPGLDDQSVLDSHILAGKKSSQALFKSSLAKSKPSSTIPNETSTAIPKLKSRLEEVEKTAGLDKATHVATKEKDGKQNDRKEFSFTSETTKYLLEKLHELRLAGHGISRLAAAAIEFTHKLPTQGPLPLSNWLKDAINGSLPQETVSKSHDNVQTANPLSSKSTSRNKDSKTVKRVPPSPVRKTLIKKVKTLVIRKFLTGRPLIQSLKSYKPFAKRIPILSIKTVKSALLNARKLKMEALDVTGQPPVKTLSYALDRVLFKQGVYNLQDPRTGVFNFDRYLQTITPEEEFDFDSLTGFLTSSEDITLQNLAKESGKKYVGSTSSMTSVLSHFHFLLSNFRPLNLSRISRAFPEPSTTFTQFTRIPASIYLRYKDGVYAVDADKEFDRASILSRLGQSLEKLLTVPRDFYEQYRKTSSEKIPDEVKNAPDAYHYSSIGNFVFRSQLDGRHEWLPGSGVFDIKTRACVTIRMNQDDYKEMSGYQIRDLYGEWESYEREYLDMLRSAMLKYSLQVRMGRMDGVFVAYHNTQEIFGFQYIPLSEMDLALHGQENLALGDQEFKFSVRMLSDVLDLVTERFPQQSIRLHFETCPRESGSPHMYIFAEPMDTATMDTVQQAETEIAKQELRDEMLGANSSLETDGAKETATEASEDLEEGNRDREMELKESVEASSKMEEAQTEIGWGESSQDQHADAGDLPGVPNAVALEEKQSSSNQPELGDLEQPVSPTSQSDEEHYTADISTIELQLQQPSKMEPKSGIDVSAESKVKQQTILGLNLSAWHIVNGVKASKVANVHYTGEWPLQQAQYRNATSADVPKVDKIWNVSYRIQQFSESEAQSLLEACKRRRRRKYGQINGRDKVHEGYLRSLKNWSARGRHRKEKEEKTFSENSPRQLGG